MPSSKRIVVFGATGQLGQDVVRAAEAVGVPVKAFGHDVADITDAAAVQRVVEEARPQAVINCAAFHQVDRCEEDPAAAIQANALGALHVARTAQETGARVVYVSTDYVFAGTKPAPADGTTTVATACVETDPTGPLNVYGATKLAGEHLTLAAAPDAVVARVASLFGVAGSRGKGGNFIETILGRARQGGPLKVVNDQWMSPTSTADAAAALLRLALSDASGVVHVTNRGACTWHAFASAAVRLAGLRVEVQPTPAAEYASKARRPRNSALHTGHLADLLGAPLRPWEEALAAYLKAKGHIG